MIHYKRLGILQHLTALHVYVSLLVSHRY